MEHDWPCWGSIKAMIPAFLKTIMPNREILAAQDLSVTSSDTHHAYVFLRDNKKDVFEPNQRLVFYGAAPTQALVDHIQKAIVHLDITNCFVTFVCPDNIRHLLDQAKQTTFDGTDIDSIVFSDVPVIELSDKYYIPDTICPQPWTSVELSANGDIRPCCIYVGKILDKNNNKININTHSIDDYYYSQSMIDLRDSFAKGERPSGCQRCWRKEQVGNPSNRLLEMNHHSENFFSASTSVADINRVKKLDFDLGNLCNLRCVICSWERSSRVAADEFNDSKSQDFKIKITDHNQKSLWIQKEEIWSKFNSVWNNIEFLEFEGGEPFFYNYHSKVLDNVAGREHEIRLRYNTNATVFPEENIQRFSKFKECHICLSIDDIEQRFEYQRTDGIWHTVKENIDRYANLPWPITVSFYITVSLQNVFYLPELLDFMSEYNLPTTVSLLYSPRDLSFGALPESAKPAVLAKLKKHTQYAHFLNPVIEAIQQAVPNEGNFCEFIAKMDKRRSTTFAQTHPEMAALLGLSLDQ
jgi:MoaA/NifB/PqqE/SkfB family radical SAM enzyme